MRRRHVERRRNDGLIVNSLVDIALSLVIGFMVSMPIFFENGIFVSAPGVAQAGGAERATIAGCRLEAEHDAVAGREHRQLLDRLEPANHAAWLKYIGSMKGDTAVRDIQSLPDNGHLYAAHVINDIWRITGGKAIIATDVGQHQMWEAQYYKHNEPRTLLTSGGLGTMGFALPAAIGAKLACPDADVWADPVANRTINQFCLECHAPDTTVASNFNRGGSGHVPPKLPDGHANGAHFQNGDLLCSDCHDWLDGMDIAQMASEAMGQRLCKDCASDWLN